MTMILEKVKTGAIIALFVLLSTTSVASYFLYQTNVNLNKDISTLNDKLSVCQNSFDKLKAQKEVADNTLESLLEEQAVVKGEFDQIKSELGNIKCKSVVMTEVRKNVESNQAGTIVDTTAANIRSVGLLLERATCRANNNCIAPESPSK